MSAARGNSVRTRPQKHQNKSAFKNNLYDKSQKIKLLNSLQITDVCQRCKDIIDWKIKYKKYKPLSAPKKCVDCGQKSVKNAYHILCKICAAERKICAKCCKPFEEAVIDGTSENNDKIQTETKEPNLNIDEILKKLPERKRRTIIRLEKRGELTAEKVSEYEGILSDKHEISFSNGSDSDFSSE